MFFFSSPLLLLLFPVLLVNPQFIFFFFFLLPMKLYTLSRKCFLHQKTSRLQDLRTLLRHLFSDSLSMSRSSKIQERAKKKKRVVTVSPRRFNAATHFTFHQHLVFSVPSHTQSQFLRVVVELNQRFHTTFEERRRKKKKYESVQQTQLLRPRLYLRH